MQNRHSIYDELHQRRKPDPEPAQDAHTEEEDPVEPAPPSRFLLNELSLVRPEGMHDATWHVLSDNLAGPGFTIVIGRAEVAESLSLEELAQQVREQLTAGADPTFTKHLFDYDVAGQPGRRMQFNRRQQGTLVHQDQVMILSEDELGTPLLVQFIATSANPTGFTAGERQRFETLLESVSLRSDDASTEDNDPYDASDAEEDGAVS